MDWPRPQFLWYSPVLGSFDEGVGIVKVNTADFSFLPESTATERGGVDVVAPHHVQVIDVLGGGYPGYHTYENEYAPTDLWHILNEYINEQ